MKPSKYDPGMTDHFKLWFKRQYGWEASMRDSKVTELFTVWCAGYDSGYRAPDFWAEPTQPPDYGVAPDGQGEKEGV